MSSAPGRLAVEVGSLDIASVVEGSERREANEYAAPWRNRTDRRSKNKKVVLPPLYHQAQLSQEDFLHRVRRQLTELEPSSAARRCRVSQDSAPGSLLPTGRWAPTGTFCSLPWTSLGGVDSSFPWLVPVAAGSLCWLRAIACGLVFSFTGPSPASGGRTSASPDAKPSVGLVGLIAISETVKSVTFSGRE